MEDKIIEVFKKYSKSVDTEYNVYNCLIEEDWSNIAQELVKLFCQPAVMRMMAVSFAKWLRDNTVADGAPKLLLRLDMKRYTIEELYDLYTLIAE